MGLLLKILSIAGLAVFLISAILAIGLYWQFNFGSCKDGCGEGMVYIFFLPAVITAIISAAIAFLSHLLGKRVR